MEGFLFVLFSHRYPSSASSSCCWERKLVLKSEIFLVSEYEHHAEEKINMLSLASALQYVATR